MQPNAITNVTLDGLAEVPRPASPFLDSASAATSASVGTLALLDTAAASTNLGDHIIMEAVRREIVGLSQSRRTESYWTRATLTDVDTGAAAAAVLLHSGVFKESFPGYPADRLMT